MAVETAQRIEVITGPTASGKTALALSRAQADDSIEIVNADAFQVYRGFDIGTAKTSLATRKQIPHHLIDIADPQESYNAGQYAHDAREAIENILIRDKKPLVVGGSGLYIDALFYGISSLAIDEEAKGAAIRKYRSELQEEGFAVLHERLKDIDPDLYAQIAREQNPLRLERAWVHYYATGTPLGEARKDRHTFRHIPYFTVLLPEREELRARIADRVDAMLEAGWLGEVVALLKHGVTKDMQAMRAIGYKEVADLADGKLTLGQTREMIITQTRQYAKRQITWMKRYQAT